MQFIQGIDFFVGPAFHRNTEQLFKARFLVGILISFLLSIISFAPMFSLIPELPSTAVWAYICIATPLSLCWLGLLHLLKKSQAFKLCSHISVASLLLVLYAGMCITGGPTGSEIHPLLVIPVIVAFFLLGQRGGVIWSVITGFIYLFLVVLDVSGILFMQLAPVEAMGVLRLFNFSYAFSLTCILVYMYEGMNSTMVKERDDEREKLEHIANVAVENSVVNDSAEALAESGDALLESAIHQKQAIEQLAVTTEELGATADKNSHLAKDAMAAIQDSDEHLLISRGDLLQLVSSMEQVKQSSKEIQSINNVINDIAYQTNLLSLNAMIEASRSSDENSGFKVVALEVKKLAERSADAAADINELLSKNLSAVQQGGQLSNKIEQRFNEIADKFGPLVQTIQQVSNASDEQNSAIRQITEGLIAIDKVIEENKNRAYRSSTAAKKLRENSALLTELVMNLEAD
ncbi:MAG: hypothetical protein HRU20_25600 [Pseudomonadales bacterium]|nr:hypothetical protein [Pseudomonadales bacterium]